MRTLLSLLHNLGFRSRSLRAAAIAALTCVASVGCDPTASEVGSAHAGAVDRGRALPRFEGTLLDGNSASTDLLLGRRALLFLFSSGDDEATLFMDSIKRVAADARAANIALVGISRDREPRAARAFLRTHAVDMPVFDDSNGAISRALAMPANQTIVMLIDSGGSIAAAFPGPSGPTEAEGYDAVLRELLHLTASANAIEPTLGVRPTAPAFSVQTLAGEALALSDLSGKVAVVVFFSPTCPHCHEALKFLDQLRRQIASEKLAIVPISVQANRVLLEQMAADLSLDLTIYLDPGGTAASDYAHRGTVPDTVIIDGSQRVVARHSGISPRLRALMTLEIRQALGVANPIMLDALGYSGEEFCGVCHSQQHQTWALTAHAYAFETLVEHGSDRDPECVACHSVGFGKKGGYDLDERQRSLEGVQCENCHGRGGPHQSPEFVAQTGLKGACEGCHTTEHSLRFNFAERLPLVSHAANAAFADLDLEERKALLERRDRRERQLFDTGQFVGSASCQECHAAEHDLWSKSAHAGAFETLRSAEKHSEADCQKCHTTGFSQAGGFPDGGDPLRGVGCESCHGPGAAHVAAGSRKEGSILRLTEKCDSCVILQICGSCHDDANDPNFEFELFDKLDIIRHGFRDRGGAAE
jgi:peroxiredoxin